MIQKFKISIISALFVFVFMACQTEKHDYIYYVTSKASTSLMFNYKLTDEDSTHYLILNQDDTIRLACRNNVVGEDIWDIETSANIFPFDNIYAILKDSSLMSEDLIARSYWSHPIAKEDSGIYYLNISDETLILERNENFSYKALAETSDSLIVTSYLQGQTRKKDTLNNEKKSLDLGAETIYTFIKNANKDEQQRNKKILSGIYSISLSLKKDGQFLNKTINLTTEDSLFTFSDKECTLKIKENIFTSK